MLYTLNYHPFVLNILVGIPVNPKRDHHWFKRKSTKAVFCQHIFWFMPRFFLHHQIDLAQRDGKQLLVSMITSASRLLCLDFDFPENYTHLNQVFHTVLWSFHKSWC